MLVCPFPNSKFPLIWIGIVRAMSIEELATAVEMQIGVPVFCESGSRSRSSGSEVKLGEACPLRVYPDDRRGVRTCRSGAAKGVHT